MKFCIDAQCEHAGESLPLSEFYKKSNTRDGRHPYCKGCVIRRATERYRERKQEVEQFGEVERKPNIATRPQFAFSLVYDAIKSGSRTREEIQRVTKLSFDDIGEALTELLFVAKGIVIRGGLFVPVEEAVFGRRIVAAPECLECFFENAERKPNVKAGQREPA